jgi:Flp pilus assembly protein CpaB
MRDVVVPAKDLAPGVTIGPDDVRIVPIPAAIAPDGVLTSPGDAIGRVPAVALQAGLPLSRALVAGGAIAALAPAGTVVVPIQFDEATAALLRAGDHVDLISTATDTPRYLVRRALVLPGATRDPGEGGATTGGGLFGASTTPAPAVTLLAVTPQEAPGLSAASGARTLAAVLVP